MLGGKILGLGGFKVRYSSIIICYLPGIINAACDKVLSEGAAIVDGTIIGVIIVGAIIGGGIVWGILGGPCALEFGCGFLKTSTTPLLFERPPKIH